MGVINYKGYRILDSSTGPAGQALNANFKLAADTIEVASTAVGTSVDSSVFSGNLSLADSTVQKALTTIDGLTAFSMSITNISDADAPYSVLAADQVILVTTNAVDTTIILPTAATNSGRVLHIKKKDSGSGTIIIEGNAAGEDIDDDTELIITNVYDSAALVCDGSDWWII